MTEQEYLKKHFPKDFIKIDDKIFLLPKDFTFSISLKEIGTTLTTADGTKRKDIIAIKKQASLKYNTVLQDGFDRLKEITEAVQSAHYKSEKTLFIKKQNATNTGNLKDGFTTIKIDTIELSKYEYKFRKINFFVYSGITLKIN